MISPIASIHFLFSIVCEIDQNFTVIDLNPLAIAAIFQFNGMKTKNAKLSIIFGWYHRMHIRDVSVQLFTCVLLIAVGATPATAASSRSNSEDPSYFIKNLADQAIQVLSTPDGSLRQREDKFRELLRNDFAMDKIGRFVVGGYWRKMNEIQRVRYQKLFSRWVLRTYSVRLGGYSGESFRVIRTTEAGRRDVIVHTRIEREGRNGFDANWRVRRVGERLKIIDIYVEGISMAVTQRSEFESILRKHGIDGLLSRLQDRLAQLSEAS